MTAIFDFDGTLLHGDSFISFARRSLTKRRLFIGAVMALPWLIAWKLRIISSSAAKMKLFGFWYKGTPLETFDRWGKEYASYIDTHTIPETKDALRTHLEAQDRVYIISASLRNWIAPWAEAQGNVHVIATMPETDSSNRLTGRFDGLNCLGEEKVRRLEADTGFDPSLPLAVYTDSLSDLPLIRLSSRTIIVKS